MWQKQCILVALCAVLAVAQLAPTDCGFNWVGNGNLAGGQGMDQQYGSYGAYSVVKLATEGLPSPIEGVEYALKFPERASGGGEYEVHAVVDMEQNNATAGKYLLSAWAYFSTEYNGGFSVVHHRFWKTGFGVIGAGNGYGNPAIRNRWQYVTAILDTGDQLPTFFSWYIGYPVNHNAGNMYVTDAKIIKLCAECEADEFVFEGNTCKECPGTVSEDGMSCVCPGGQYDTSRLSGLETCADVSNFIGNGNFAGGEHITNMVGSYGEYAIGTAASYSIPAPPSGSEYVLRFQGAAGRGGEYEVHQKEGMTNFYDSQPGIYLHSCWAFIDEDFSGNGNLMHARWWNTGGAVIGASDGAVNKDIRGKWQYLALYFDMGNNYPRNFDWYIAYPATHTAGALYVTDVKIVRVGGQCPAGKFLYQGEECRSCAGGTVSPDGFSCQCSDGYFPTAFAKTGGNTFSPSFVGHVGCTKCTNIQYAAVDGVITCTDLTNSRVTKCADGSTRNRGTTKDTCEPAACPSTSTGNNVVEGCTCKAGYSGSVEPTAEAPFYTDGCRPVSCPSDTTDGTDFVSTGCRCKDGHDGSIAATTSNPFYSNTCAPIRCPVGSTGVNVVLGCSCAVNYYGAGVTATGSAPFYDNECFSCATSCTGTGGARATFRPCPGGAGDEDTSSCECGSGSFQESSLVCTDYTCTGATGGSGTDCKTCPNIPSRTENEHCLTCYPGHQLSGTDCVEYTCNTGSSGSVCASCPAVANRLEDQHCATCNAGYGLVDRECVPYSCETSNSGSACLQCEVQLQRTQDNHCNLCNNGHRLDGPNCVPYTCDGPSDGAGASCASCPAEQSDRMQDEHCSSCYAGYVLNGRDCELEFQCDGPTQANRPGTACETCVEPRRRQQDEHCATCQNGYIRNGRECVLLTCEIYSCPVGRKPKAPVPSGGCGANDELCNNFCCDDCFSASDFGAASALQSLIVTDEVACQLACLNAEKCDFFTFVETCDNCALGQVGDCFLIETKVIQDAPPGETLISGPKQCQSFTCHGASWGEFGSGSDCRSCPDPANREQDEHCTACYNGYSLDDKTCVPTFSCDGAEGGSDSDCFDCVAVESRSRDEQCSSCYPGYSANEGVCSETYTCTVGSSGSVCATCPLPAARRQNNQCATCNAGYKLSARNYCIPYTCEGALSNAVSSAECLACDEIPQRTVDEQCKTCRAGHYLSQDKTCVPYECTGAISGAGDDCKTCVDVADRTSDSDCASCWTGYKIRGKDCVPFTCDGPSVGSGTACASCPAPGDRTQDEQCASCHAGHRLDSTGVNCQEYECNVAGLTLGRACRACGPVVERMSDDHCTSCYAGHGLNEEAFTCEPFSCPSGSGSECATCYAPEQRTKDSDCLSCNDGHKLLDRSCVPYSCNGADEGSGSACASCPAVFTERLNDEHCASCYPGYHLEGTICVENVCSCPNGVVTVGYGSGGTLCSVDGQEDCSGCYPGYYMSGRAAANSQETCTQCAVCGNGYRWTSPCGGDSPGVCETNQCTCENGTPAGDNTNEEDTCYENMAEDCSKCKFGYYLDSPAGTGSQTCIPKVTCSSSMTDGCDVTSSDGEAQLVVPKGALIGVGDYSLQTVDNPESLDPPAVAAVVCGPPGATFKSPGVKVCMTVFEAPTDTSWNVQWSSDGIEWNKISAKDVEYNAETREVCARTTHFTIFAARLNEGKLQGGGSVSVSKSGLSTGTLIVIFVVLLLTVVVVMYFRGRHLKRKGVRKGVRLSSEMSQAGGVDEEFYENQMRELAERAQRAETMLRRLSRGGKGENENQITFDDHGEEEDFETPAPPVDEETGDTAATDNNTFSEGANMAL